MTTQYTYPKHIKSGLLNELLASYDLRDTAGLPPAPGELSKRHKDYVRQLLRHYAEHLTGIHLLRSHAYRLLAEMAMLPEQMPFEDQLNVIAHELGGEAVVVLRLTDTQCVLTMAAEEREIHRKGQEVDGDGESAGV